MELFTRIDEIIDDNVRIIDRFDGIIDDTDEMIDRFDGIIDRFIDRFMDNFPKNCTYFRQFGSINPSILMIIPSEW